MLSDLRFAIRLLAKSPGFTAVAILTLAIAIGTNSAIFSLINSVLLHSPVPVRPEEVVCIFTTRQDVRRAFRQFSYAEFAALRENHEVFSDVAAVNFNHVSLGREEGLRRSFAFMVSDNFFALMGTTPAAGRFFTTAETRPNAGTRVVVAGYSLWQRLGGGPDFVGSTLLINGQPHIVIGVAPEGFSGVSALIAPELWLPLGLFADATAAFGPARKSNDLSHPENYTLNLMGRMLPGLTLETARKQLPVLAARLTAIQPPDSGGARELVLAKPFGIGPEPADPGPLRLMGLLLLSLSGVILLIACLNLANMMLARGSARAGEMALRLALGATRGQLVRQLCTEGLVLAVIGGTLGLLLSLWANSFLQDFFATLLGSMNFTLTAHLEPDLAVIAATFLFCLLATLLFSLGPSLNAARADLVRDLKTRTGDAAVRHWNRFFSGRHLLVMGQMTLSLVLIFSAGLFLRTAWDAGNLETDAGFTADGVVLAEFDFSLANATEPAALRQMLAAVERVRRLPGVSAAGLTTFIPYTNGITPVRLVPAGATPAPRNPAAAQAGTVGIHSAITSGFLDSIGIRLLRGRDFTESETREPGAGRVCIVDEGMARKLFPNRDALGQRVRLDEAPGDALPGEMEIVGISRRHSHGLEDKGRPVAEVYVPLAQAYHPVIFLSARFGLADPAAVRQATDLVRRQLHLLDPDLPVLQVLPFTVFTGKNFTLWMVHLGAVMFGVFGGIALLLVIVGVYGVKAYAVERRTREIGIRLALGADRRDVFSLVMKQGAQQTAFSLGLGLVLCLFAGRALATVFFQVAALDPVVLAGAAGVLSAATLLACWLPARRAAKVDPLVALRAE